MVVILPTWKVDAFCFFVAFPCGGIVLEVGACCVAFVFGKPCFDELVCLHAFSTSAFKPHVLSPLVFTLCGKSNLTSARGHRGLAKLMPLEFVEGKCFSALQGTRPLMQDVHKP